MNLLSPAANRILVYVAMALLLACGVLAASLRVESSKHKAEAAVLTGERDIAIVYRDAYKAKVIELAKVNSANAAATDELAKRLSDEVGRKQDTAKALADAERSRDQARTARDLALNTIRDQREQTYATDSTCSAWAAAAVCGPVTDGVLQQWRQAAQPAGN